MEFSAVKKRYIFFVVLSIITVFDLAIFFYLPLLSNIRQDLGVNEALIQLSASIYTLGIGISALIYGGLSDFWGRRRLVISGVIIFTFASLGVSYSSSILQMLVFRFAQGLGAGVAWSIGNSILSDIYKGRSFQRAIIFLHTMVGVIIVFSPFLGGYIGSYLGWRNTFKLISIIGCLAIFFTAYFLPETMDKPKSSVNLKKIFATYLYLLQSPKYLQYLAVKVIAVSIIFTNLVNLPLIFVETYNTTVQYCGILMGLGSLVFAVGGYINDRITAKYSTQSIIKSSLFFIIFSCFSLLIMESSFGLSAESIQILKIPYNLAIAAVLSMATHEVVNYDSKISGSASSLMITLEMFFSTTIIKIISIFYNGTIIPMEIYTLIACVLSFAICSLRVESKTVAS